MFNWFASKPLGFFFSPSLSQFVHGIDYPAALTVTEVVFPIKETHTPSANFTLLEAQ